MSNAADNVTLAILAGGRGSRLGTVDKAGISRAGIAQLDRWLAAFGPSVSSILLCDRGARSAQDARSVADDARWGPDAGPIAGLAAAAEKTATDWLLTLPVDTVALPDGLLAAFLSALTPQDRGVRLVDADGVQPLIALWRVAPLHEALELLRGRGIHAIQALQEDGFREVRRPDFRCGNLNTPDDLREFGAMLKP